MRDVTVLKAPEATAPEAKGGRAVDALKGVAAAVERCLEALTRAVEEAVVGASQDVVAAVDRTNPVTWTLTDEDSALWECGGCGCEWTFSAGDPAENGMKYCPGCGHPLADLVYHPEGVVQGELDLDGDG
jgi:hypothetical protein